MYNSSYGAVVLQNKKQVLESILSFSLFFKSHATMPLFSGLGAIGLIMQQGI